MSMPASKSQLTTIDNAMREARLSPADYFLGILSSMLREIGQKPPKTPKLRVIMHDNA